jgi:hypothetical protein
MGTRSPHALGRKALGLYGHSVATGTLSQGTGSLWALGRHRHSWQGTRSPRHSVARAFGRWGLGPNIVVETGTLSRDKYIMAKALA